MNELIDKRTFERLYREKWAGAHWIEDTDNGDDDIVIDAIPASSHISPSTTPTESPTSSRRTTSEEVYVPFTIVNTDDRPRIRAAIPRGLASPKTSSETSPTSQHKPIQRSRRSLKRMYSNLSAQH